MVLRRARQSLLSLSSPPSPIPTPQKKQAPSPLVLSHIELFTGDTIQARVTVSTVVGTLPLLGFTFDGTEPTMERVDVEVRSGARLAMRQGV